MTPCEHPEESVECFHDTSDLATEHAEWCSICGAYRVVSGFDDKPWTLPKVTLPPLMRVDPDGTVTPVESPEELDHLRSALKKFGRHPTGDMEGVGRCAGFMRGAPFREELCNCGLNAALTGSPVADRWPEPVNGNAQFCNCPEGDCPSWPKASAHGCKCRVAWSSVSRSS